MQTEDLIRSLSVSVAPVAERAVERRLATGIAMGALGTLALVAFALGFRPDLDAAIHGFPFWTKLAYTLSLGIGGIIAAAHFARPDAIPSRLFWLLGVPVLLLSYLAFEQMAQAPSDAWLAIWLGHSWKICSSLVFVLSIPIFLGLLWAFRQFAPTRLASTGAAAGLASGGFAAAIYCFHCPEVSASFVVTWYSLGIAFPTLAGALLGPRLLRW